MWRAACLVLLLGAASAIAGGRRDPGELWVARFSDAAPHGLPDGWRPLTLPKARRHTRYELVSVDGRTVVQADADRSASALMKKVTIDPRAFPSLEWSWKITGVLAGAAWQDKAHDDFAGRLFVLFESPGGPLSFARTILMRFSGGFSGDALNYVWAGNVDTGQTARSPYTDRVAMIVVESGNDRAGAWVVEQRNVLDDFEAAFGGAPGPIVAIALMTDTDNTRSRASAYYGDIRFVSSATRPGTRAVPAK
ncbi:MAG: DUF3047 domain-containing protein [Acidobacteria bacterium]|nr:DUF3047 domain-containing protein [Acidobacteriota bacterium]